LDWASFVALVPVAARNYAVAGEAVTISSHGGLNFYIGNNAGADGTYRGIPGITPSIQGQAVDAKRVAEAAEGRSLSSAEVSGHFYRRAFDWMRDNPSEAALLWGRKALYLLNRTPLTLNHSYTFYSRDEPTLLRLLFVGPWLLIPLGIVGLLGAAWRVESRAYLDVGGVRADLRSSPWWPSSSRRATGCRCWCLSASAQRWEPRSLWRAARLRRTTAAAATTLAAAALLTIAAWDFGLDDGLSEERTRMAVWLASQGRSAEAGRADCAGRARQPHRRRCAFPGGAGLRARRRSSGSPFVTTSGPWR
jgi:hypothetical protein